MSCLGDLPNVFQWNDKILTGVTLLSLNFICLSLIFSSSGIVYLLLNFLLFFTVVSLAYVRLIAFVKNIPIKHEEEEDYAFIPEECLKNFMLKVFSCYKQLRNRIKGDLNSKDSGIELKVVAGLLVAGMLGDLMSIYTWLLFGINLVFALTFLKNEKGIDCCQECHKYTEVAKKQVNDLMRRIPKYSDLKKE